VTYADNNCIAHAIDTCGLTFTEVADRAGVDPDDLQRLPLEQLPLAVLARLADAIGVPFSRLLCRSGEHDAEEPNDAYVVGAYLAEFPDGLTRDALAESLNWTLVRVERAFCALDASLRCSGMRLRAEGARVVVAGRLEHTDGPTRNSLERLHAVPGADTRQAALMWHSIQGIDARMLKDLDGYDVADRRGLLSWRNGRLRPSRQVEFSLCINGYRR
jgi:transcriptional regulator with XRE-family HTH domain